MEEKKVRRVQVTASVPGAYELVGQIAAPAELRTPTGMEPQPGSRKMRMEAGRQREQCKQVNTKRAAYHFLPPYYMDRGHPSRLPSGSLCSAWTGPGRDPKGIPGRRKWQAMAWRRAFASRWSEPHILPLRSNSLNLFLTSSGLLMEGTESNRRRQPFQGCLPIRLRGSESGQVKLGETVTRDHV
jgi:hypothetical protein